MPELPEVEAARRAIDVHCVGKRIRRCVVADDPKVIDGVSPRDLEAALVGKAVVAARRKGKNLWLQLDSPPFPSFQFGMTGAFYIKGVEMTQYKRSAVSSMDEWPSKFSKVFIEFEDGLELSFTDKRRFARVRLLESPESAPPISELGPDALSEPIEVDEFLKSLSKKKTGIKALLLDQSYISGIGNWIADEVLYQARIHPLQIAASLSKESIELLHKCIKEVIEKALEVGADSSRYPKNWIFHSREQKPGKAFVDGKKIDFITAGGRTSAYVPALQKLTGSEPGKVQPSGRTRKRKSNENGNDEAESAGEEEQLPGRSKSRITKSAAVSRKEIVKSSDSDSDSDSDELQSEEKEGRNKKQEVKAESRKRSKTNEASAQKKKKVRK